MPHSHLQMESLEITYGRPQWGGGSLQSTADSSPIESNQKLTAHMANYGHSHVIAHGAGTGK